MKKSKILAYLFLIISFFPIPAYLIAHMRDFRISVVPYLLSTGVSFLLATFFNSKTCVDAGQNCPLFTVTRKTMKWSGLLYGAIFVLVVLFMSVFIVADKIEGNTPATALAQGAGWLVMFVVGIPVILVTPIIIIYNLFVLFTDLFCFFCKRGSPQVLGMITKLENINILKAHPRANFILDILGCLLFIGTLCCMFLFFVFS
ncbi:MAG: hypothetical protein J6Y17_01290 [Elusimicrobiaceae bacterium]|nr:hypothetical protein [Elusimicrobiaceae bacterium]